jgi:tetratricopeptide (TPR) repeat protein
MVYYVRNHAGWLNALFRVGGDFDLLEMFISNGYPVIIETGYEAETGWVGHYLLATGYDRPSRTLTVQDVTAGPNQEMLYEQVDILWRQFNRMYILVFPASEWDKISHLLAENATPDANRLHALQQTLADTENRPGDAFAWFAHGSNLTYFNRYREASRAYDRALQIGLPWRMLFYQFGPYIAYFNVGRYQDVVDLATATLQARPDLEESYVWRGWARYMLGDSRAAVADFKDALRVNPNFLDANTGLQALGEQ